MRHLMLIAAIGCAPPAQKAPHTAMVCGLDSTGEFVDQVVFAYPAVSARCVAAIRADFGADDLPRHALETGNGWDSAEGTLVAGAWALLHYDWAIQHRSLDHVLQGAANDGHALYDWAAQFRSVVEGDSHAAGASYSRLHDRLTLNSGEPPLAAMTVLLHEASHADGERHVRCHTGERNCDDNDAGAYGTTIAVMDGIDASTDYEWLQTYADQERAWARSMIQE